MRVNCSVLRLNNEHFDQADGLSLGENSGGDSRHLWRWPASTVRPFAEELSTSRVTSAMLPRWNLKKANNNKDACVSKTLGGFHLVAGAATSLVHSFVVLIVCTTSEPVISFTYFSQNHFNEYAKGRLCGTRFPLEKTGCSLTEKKKHFRFASFFIKQYEAILKRSAVWKTTRLAVFGCSCEVTRTTAREIKKPDGDMLMFKSTLKSQLLSRGSRVKSSAQTTAADTCSNKRRRVWRPAVKQECPLLARRRICHTGSGGSGGGLTLRQGPVWACERVFFPRRRTQHIHTGRSHSSAITSDLKERPY